MENPTRVTYALFARLLMYTDVGTTVRTIAGRCPAVGLLSASCFTRSVTLTYCTGTQQCLVHMTAAVDHKTFSWDEQSLSKIHTAGKFYERT